MKIRLVKQEDKSGCTVACIATVMGKTYQEVKADFANDFIEDGVSIEQVAEYISDHGYETLLKSVLYRLDRHTGRKWIMEPFAPVHIVRVRYKSDTVNHVVVMDKKGVFYDPDGQTDEQIRESYLVMGSLGIFPLK